MGGRAGRAGIQIRIFPEFSEFVGGWPGWGPNLQIFRNYLNLWPSWGAHFYKILNLWMTGLASRGRFFICFNIFSAGVQKFNCFSNLLVLGSKFVQICGRRGWPSRGNPNFPNFQICFCTRWLGSWWALRWHAVGGHFQFSLF